MSQKMKPKFIDEVKIEVRWGKGGDGIVAWRREKYIPYGGPAWGDGGDGWNVILQASKDENTLLPFHYKKIFKASWGEMGKWDNQSGKKWEDLVLKVPIGTVVKDAWSWEIIWTLIEDWQRLLVAKGGRWWWGNARFKSSTRQFPSFAIKGEMGDHRTIKLELQLFGDVALIGLPSVGKSSLINFVAWTKVKVAEYPFTTLTPHLWIVKHKGKDFIMVDIPWLIQWASEGKGLGLFFLRHILKSRIWAFVIDASGGEESITAWVKILDEIKAFVEWYLGEILSWEKIKHIDWRIVPYAKKNILILKLIVKVSGEQDQIKEIEVFNKGLIFLLNKSDMVPVSQRDSLKNKAIQFVKDYFKSSFAQSVDNKILNSNVFWVCAACGERIGSFLDKVLEELDALDSQRDFNDFIFEQISETHYKKQEYITEIPEEKQVLIEEGYIEQDHGERVWEVYHPYLSWLAFVLPWDNDEAVLRFWEQLRQKWILAWLEKNEVKLWDILKIIPSFRWWEPIYIKYEL